MREMFDQRLGLMDPPPWVDRGDDLDREMLDASLVDGYEVDVLEELFLFSGADDGASLDAFAGLCSALDAAEQTQFVLNRAMAAHLEAVREALAIAARNPGLYLRPRAGAAADAAELAVRAAATELSMRLHVPAGTIRNRAHEATVLQERLPSVWSRFADGAASYIDARIAVDAAVGFESGDERLAELDAELAAAIGTMTTTRFRQRVRTVGVRLEREHLEARHTRALAQRRVVVDHVDDGMAWVSVYTSSVEAARIWSRLDATARRDAGAAGEPRTLDQLRADAAVAWMAGDGTPTPARAEVIVTIPLLSIAGGGSEPATLDGVGPIDLATARQLFADAPSFLRLAVDPITAAPLVLDRTRYRPSKAQRLWLALTHGRCSRPGCDRLAVSADIDHSLDWSSGGPTNAENLAPACRGDHVLKHATRFVTAKLGVGTTTWRSPTGRVYSQSPPF